jgi:hypothetical protein
MKRKGKDLDTILAKLGLRNVTNERPQSELKPDPRLEKICKDHGLKGIEFTRRPGARTAAVVVTLDTAVIEFRGIGANLCYFSPNKTDIRENTNPFKKSSNPDLVTKAAFISKALRRERFRNRQILNTAHTKEVLSLS